MKRAERRKLILDAAVRVAARHGLKYVTHVAVSEECFWPTSPTTIWRVIGDTATLIRLTARHSNRV